MEFLVGESLRSCIARAAPLPIESCLHIGFQLAESLSWPISTASFTEIPSPTTSC